MNGHAFTKIRLTGGEPTLRKDLLQIVGDLHELKRDGLQKIGMTTNGVALATGSRLLSLRDAGLDSINVSLDTLVPAKFEFITRRRGLDRVLAVVDEAAALGMDTKVNVVVQRGINDDEVVDLARLAQDKDVTVRFIEFMPFGGNEYAINRMVPTSQLMK